MSKLFEDFKMFPQITKDIRVSDKEAVLNDEDVLKAKAEVEEKLKDNGRILLRKSETEPVVKVMVEASCEEECISLVDCVVDVIIKKGYMN